jgi:capsular exopolysaccharide synthesis family protein
MPNFPFFPLTRRRGVLRSIDDAAQLGVPVLGSISSFEPRPGARLPDERYPEALEAYQRLTEKLRLPDFHLRGRAIVVTSVERGGGKSTTAKNLATLLARAGGKTVLVDADLNRVARRRPGDGTSSSGFAGLLVNQLMRPANSLVHTMDMRLKLLPAGSVAGPADALMESTRLPRVVEGLRDLADYVIFDVAPVEKDLTHLTRLADVILVVLRSGSINQKDAARAIATLRESNNGLLGTVLNRAPVVIAAPQPELEATPAEEAAELPEETGKRLEIAVDELLADLEAAVSLIRDLRQVPSEDDEGAEEEEETELVTMDR